MIVGYVIKESGKTVITKVVPFAFKNKLICVSCFVAGYTINYLVTWIKNI